MSSLRIRTGDTVVITSGKDKGKTGSVLRVDQEKSRVYVEGRKIQKVSSKPRSIKNAEKGGQVGGIIEREGPIHISNVALIDPQDGKPTRIHVVRETGGRSRRSARTGAKLD